MSRPLIDNPDTMAALVTDLGGTVIPGPTFRFDLPLAEVQTVVPKIHEIAGVGCRKVGEHQGDHPTKLMSSRTIATIELYRRPEQKLDRLPESGDFRC